MRSCHCPGLLGILMHAVEAMQKRCGHMMEMWIATPALLILVGFVALMRGQTTPESSKSHTLTRAAYRGV